MDIEYIKKEKNEIEFVIKDEDSSFFDLIVDCAQSKREVEFVSKKYADNLEKKFTIYLKTKDKSAKDVLLDCINDAEEKFNTLIKNLSNAANKIE